MAAPDVNQRAQPYTFDLGNLLCNDPNPLPSLADNKEETLRRTAQACAQSLIHQLLTTCPITKADDGGLQINLPAPETPLPREKPVPKEKEKTKWDKFAEKKGIKKRSKDGKLKFDEGSGEWVQKYGYKPGMKKSGEVSGDWLQEVDEKAEKQAKEGAKGPKGKEERREKKLKARKAK